MNTITGWIQPMLVGILLLAGLFFTPQFVSAQLTTDPSNYYATRYILLGNKYVTIGSPMIEHQGTYSPYYDASWRYGFNLFNGTTTTGIGRVYHVRDGGGRSFEHNIYPLDGIVVTPEYTWTKEGQYEIDFYTTRSDLINVDQYLTTLTFDLEFRDGIPPACDLSFDPDTITEPGVESTLHWSTTNAQTLVISDGIGTVATTSGSVTVTPLVTTTYFATSTNASGTTATCSATQEVAEPEELHLQAALLAKQLVDFPDGYLWGGKGWDYNLGEFTTTDRIRNGYTYYNPDTSSKQSGVGLDCSGLITWAYNRSYNSTAGFSSNYVQYVNADGLFKDYQSDPVAEADLRPGDTLSFDWDNNGRIDHVAMYVGESGGYDVVDATSNEFGIRGGISSQYESRGAFRGYRRIHQANSALAVTTGSPVDLVVTDPSGNTLDASTVIYSDEEYIREIPGEMYYVEMEQGHDGRPKDQIISPKVIDGEYTIKVVPEAGADPAATYSLSVAINGVEVEVVSDALVSSIPTGGYSLEIKDDQEPVVVPKTLALLDELESLVLAFPESTQKRQGGLRKNIEAAKAWFVKERVDQVERKVLKVQTDTQRHLSEMLSREELAALQVLVTAIIDTLTI